MVAHHRVHEHACCHPQADCRVWDKLRSPTLDLRVSDFIYFTFDTNIHHVVGIAVKVFIKSEVKDQCHDQTN